MNIVTVRLESKILFMPTEVTVLLPEDPVETGEKLEVVWLLHGAGSDSKTMLGSADMEGMMRKHRMAFVLPSALNSDFGNYEQFGTGYNFPAYFFEELMPFIYATFPISGVKEDNYLAGVSMGGFGTFSLGLQKPEKFSALGVMGASLRESAFLKDYIDLDSVGFRKVVLADRSAFPTEYGRPEEGMKLKELNVITKYPTIRDFLDSPDAMWERFPEVAKRGELPQIYVACGTEDLFYPGTVRLQKLVEEMGVTDRMVFKIAEGVGHSGDFFDAEIEHFLDYYKIGCE
ncbi:MAG: esterase family protein [Lachnospiraceae bacterium]|nr:esterase family protein [Lachnospiraceae bacterium]